VRRSVCFFTELVIPSFPSVAVSPPWAAKVSFLQRRVAAQPEFKVIFVSQKVTELAMQIVTEINQISFPALLNMPV
jgi:hypothetical protein